MAESVTLDALLSLTSSQSPSVDQCSHHLLATNPLLILLDGRGRYAATVLPKLNSIVLKEALDTLVPQSSGK